MEAHFNALDETPLIKPITTTTTILDYNFASYDVDVDDDDDGDGDDDDDDAKNPFSRYHAYPQIIPIFNCFNVFSDVSYWTSSFRASFCAYDYHHLNF